MLKDDPLPSPTRYVAKPPEEGIRAYMPDVRRAIEKAEQTGASRCALAKRVFWRNHSSTRISGGAASGGGHIPGAKSIPWAQAVRETDGTFKSREELEALYEGERRYLG